MLSSTACPVNSGKSHFTGKQLLVLFVLLFTVLFSYTVVAQELGLIKKGIETSFPEKIHKLVLDPLPAGTYSVGNGGYFPTIDSAFNKLSMDGVAGTVTLELINTLYIAPTDSFGFFLNGPIPGAGPNSRVTIKPAANKNVTIEGDGGSVISFLNTNYVTVDGVGLTGTTTLTIHTVYNNTFSYNDGIDFLNNSDHNVIQNIIFICEDYTRLGGGPGFFNPSSSAFACDSNLIQNNYIKKAGWAIVISSQFSTVRATGNIIRGNIVGSENDSLISQGIQLVKCQNTIVENNIVQNIRFLNNNITIGIISYWGNGDIIRNNIIHNVYANSGAWGSEGILLAGASGQEGANNLVYNNMIYDIRSSAVQTNCSVDGIGMWRQINPKIYYNSVYLSGNGNGANPLGSQALAIWNNCTNVDARNNIFVNTRNESPFRASAIQINSGSSLNTSNFNDLYYSTGTNNCLVRMYGVNYNTLADWQATGHDLNSITEMPNFISPYLHIDKTFPTNLERGATPIATITTDFDGDLRNVTTPDIGADEFDGFTIEDPLPAGTYTIGTGGNFASIQEAFDKLSTDGIAGNVTLELIDNLYTAPTDSFGFKLVGPIPGAGSNSRVTIKPAENKNVTIEGNGRAVVSFLNTRYVTIDGVNLNGPRTLRIHSLFDTQYSWSLGAVFYHPSANNIIQNITFEDENYTKIGATIAFMSFVNTTSTADSNLIENNFIKKACAGIYISGWSASAKAKSNIVRGNIIGSATDSLITWGIQIERNENSIIENNRIDNIKQQFNLSVITHGINIYLCTACEIRNNVLHNIRSGTLRGTTGILVSGDLGEFGVNNLIYNNMIYDIQSTSTQVDSRVSGILVWDQINPKIYYNSVYLSGTGANKKGSAALYVEYYNTVTNLDAKNNILVNTRDESPYYATAIFDYTATNLTSDYNDLYSNNYLVRIGSTNYNTLTDWQATGKDSNSVTEMPNFISPYLHIVENEETLLESRGIPISGINVDFDEQTRHTTTPDIGADEFNGIAVGVEEEETLPTEFALEQNYPNPFNPTTTFRYSIPQSSKVVIKVFDILGNEIALLMDEEKPVGTYELTWNATSLPSGVYFYQLLVSALQSKDGKAGEYVSTKKMILLK